MLGNHAPSGYRTTRYRAASACPWLVAIVALQLIGAVSTACAHGAASQLYRTTITSITPASVPVTATMVRRDQLRVTNRGSGTLELCGYQPDRCDVWVRISPRGVYVDEHAASYFANSQGTQQGTVPANVDELTPKWRRVSGGRTYTYHDHRFHWMGNERLPPGIDAHDTSPQRVYDSTVRLRYDGREGAIHGRLDYVGGRSRWSSLAEPVLIASAVIAMVVAYVSDSRRRRRRRGDVGAAHNPRVASPADGH